ncbi:MAG TPA: universal stress protein [Thermodesulfobacteriota bacterium]|jgi:nucleotide-binding universal stress UspA family protein|nr:universal stress protein [Thermodesulfobacteriota bacterium]
MKEFKKILFPIDFSESTPKILPYVKTMSQTFGAGVYLLYVVRDLKYLTSFHVPHPSLDLIEKEIAENSEKMMEKVCEEDLQGCPLFVKKIVVGDAANEIIRYAGEIKADLIIMGTHGRKGLEKALFGSVAEQVVKNSPVPVLIINPYKV